MPTEANATFDERPVRDFATGGVVVTLLSQDGKVQRGRPVTVAEEYDGTLRFLASRSTHWVEALRKGDAATVVVADPGQNVFAVLTGTVRVSDHRGTLERLSSTTARAFFDGVDDLDLTVVEFRASGGQWWDGPATKIGAAFGRVRAALSRDESDAGDAGMVTPR